MPKRASLPTSAPLIEAETGVSVSDLRDQYLDFAWDEVSYDGGVWAFPFDTDTRALYYRRDILEDAGVDLEPVRPGQRPDGSRDVSGDRLFA
ncbi:MAG: hypothetical protein U5L04_13675 [Trueperaceae bacterium]|nr:hypothetical protein [Trueperaceae bacterium]